MAPEDEDGVRRDAEDGARAPRWVIAYTRAVGAAQVLFTSYFGWMALDVLGSVVQEEGTFKGDYRPPIDVFNLYQGTMLALLSLSGFIGGCGLVGLRPWARGWEVAYLVLVSVITVAVVVIEARRGRDFEYVAPFSLALTLPYLPVLVTRPSRRRGDDNRASCA